MVMVSRDLDELRFTLGARRSAVGPGRTPLPHSTRGVRPCTRRGFVAPVTRIAQASRRTQLFLMMDARAAASPTVTAALDQRREWRRRRGEHAVTIDCPCLLASVADD